MAKRKKKKSQKKLQQQLKYELLGILFIFLAILGSGASAISEGAIPNWLELLFRLLFGIWYIIASLALLGIGLFLVIKRRLPTLLNRRLIGTMIVFLALLLVTHIGKFELAATQNASVLQLTWSNYMAFVNGNMVASDLGGGLLGGILFAFTYVLFSPDGAKIVAFFSFLIGIVFITDFSIGAFLEKKLDGIKSRMKAFAKNRKMKKAEQIEQVNTEEEIEIDGPFEDVPEENTNVTEVLTTEPVIQEFTDIAHQSIDSEKDKTSEDKKESNNEAEESEAIQALPLTEMENIDYQLPSLDLLDEPKSQHHQQAKGEIQATVRKLERTFQSFGVKARVTRVHVGPAVTKYEVYPEAGVKVSKIVNLHDDLALALAAKDIRIEAPIPGKSAVGIEVPNKEIATVSLREVLETNQASNASILSFVLGRDISGDAVVAELNKMPHLLVAGATGSGKSVCINGIITSILMRAKPHEVKMMMIDPKKVELNIYNGVPHLLTPVVTDPKKASRALKKVVAEMERRYELFSDTGNRNIEGYNEYIKRYNNTAPSEEQQPLLPYIVVLVDELADLMMVASSEVEDAITRLAQMARAAGIHLIIATQRPSVDVITGVIKANIPSRIAFSVSSQTDSRTILDAGGAEKLLGRGDMLFTPVGSSKPTRIQGAFLSDAEVEHIVDHCIEQQKAQYQEEMIPEEESDVQKEVEDVLFDEAVQLIIEMQSASVSMLQRRFRIGYTRAARLIDAMEERGIVGPYEGSKPRSVLVSEYPEQKTS
ncbi:DNA translocase SpoIIIE [Paraliobacillus sp. PM-2]|uniref:FtsK/SpoIIIE family DNA translocase n=1 Tax=Paraliobacillus sp. PM-2 TaxID=1462524 RepID=UPI00061BF50F|nr:DNA translocase FtsK [Paraliobacillus sp. PM-2]CQR47640.1 DNA translocase SpoIIIE [Paraliobacillus sp. PM-2]